MDPEMLLVAASRPDEASMNIRERLLEAPGWRERGTFDGIPVHEREGVLLVTLQDLHLDRDHLDRQVARALGVSPEAVAFASRHSSQSGVRSFTVHPLGNWGRDAPYGGRPRNLVPTAPHWMTQALRLLRVRAEGFEHEVTFEATHHGPYLETPAFFIEVGSDARSWGDPEAARVVADVLLALRPQEGPVALGLGGGHYVPRMTDLALGRRVSFGHMVPSYAVAQVGLDLWREAVARSPGAALVYVHRKALKGEDRVHADRLLEATDLTVVHARDLEPL